MTYYHLFLQRPAALSHWSAEGRGNGFYFGADLYPIWLTSREAVFHGRNPYAADMTRDIQTGLFGRPIIAGNPAEPPANYRAFSYPIYADLLLAPVAAVPFERLRIYAVIVLATLLAATLLVWLHALGLHNSPLQNALLVTLTVANYYALEALYAEQLGIVVGFVLAATALAVVQQNLAWAGVLLAFTTIKPQMSILLVAGLLIWSLGSWRKRRALPIAFWVTMFVLWLAGEWIQRGWITGWWCVLTGYRDYASGPLTQLFLGSRGGIALGLVTVCAVLFAWWRARHEQAGSRRFAIMIASALMVTSIAVLPAHAVYDQLILLPAILLVLSAGARIWQRSLLSKVAVVLAMFALGWQWIAAFAITVAATALTPNQIRHSLIALRLPLYGIYIFPFLLLGLFWIVRDQIEA